ncbi:MAG: HAMP domain-containing histidine kinase [Gemmatimonadota bacterium]|nr:HAMP domain-containing histidine kinase [Gemmatimonadota bacterium]
MDRASALDKLARRIPLICATTVVGIAVIVLSGWALGFYSDLVIVPGGTMMPPLAAVCFLAAAGSLVLAERAAESDVMRWLQQLLALAIVAVALVELFEFAYARDIGIDQLLFRDAVLAAPWRPAGRVPLNGAAAFLLMGFGLFSVSHDIKKRSLRSQIFTSAGMVIALTALLGYVFGVSGLYAIPHSSGMPLLGAAAFLILGVGIIFSHRDRGFSALMVDHGAAGVMTRRLLPAALILPVMLGLLRLAGQGAGLYETDFGVSLNAIASIATFLGVILWAARVLRDMDADRSALILREQQTRSAAERARLEAETARAEAERANTIKTDFLAVMSHELRTPLTAIMGYEELLSDGITGPVTEEQRQQLGRINASAHHLLGLIDEILTFARVDIGREKVRLEQLSLNTAIAEAAALVEPMAAAKTLRFVVVNLFEDRVILTDRMKLKQMLVNLLSNAIKFTDQGEVRLTAAIRGELVELCVSDTGIGIEPTHLESIFEAFWQVEQGATRKIGGAGLGLSVTRKLARLLGGDVTVKTGVGKGSTFTLTLPLVPPTPTTQKRNTPASSPIQK